MSSEITVDITVGNDKYIGVDKHHNLICYATKDGIVTDYINLGLFTQKRYQELSEYMERLSIHTKD